MATAECSASGSPPLEGGASSLPSDPAKRHRKIIVTHASFFIVATEGVRLAEESDCEEQPEEYFTDYDDEYDDDLSYGSGKWKRRKCKSGSRSTSSYKKPKVTQGLVKVSSQRRDLKTKANIQSCASAQKENTERRLQEKGLQRFGYGIYHRRSDNAATSKPTKITAPRSYVANKPRWKSTGNAEDHPSALKYELRVKATTDELLRQLADLQHRDLTPEDYELLLRLDEKVAPKTVSRSLLASFETVILESVNSLIGELCSICMERYSESQGVKTLPCNHTFHSDCINMWLSSASLNCPLDGIPVES